MQKEQIDRFVTLAGLEMPALISPGKFQEAEIYEDSAVLMSTVGSALPAAVRAGKLHRFCRPAAAVQRTIVAKGSAA